MYTRNSWGNTIKSEEQQTMMNSFIESVTFDVWKDKEIVRSELEEMDKRLSRVHAPANYDPMIINKEIQPYFIGTRKLSLPKSNTLTDSLIRNSLGCDEKYAKSYVELLESTKEDMQKERRVEDIKKRFSQSNSFVDVFANTKPHYLPQTQQKFRPVVDNEHESYLKTQLIFLEKPKNSKYNEKQYFEKHFDEVTKKIEELGGMEDTISKMERSLNSNEIKSMKKKETLENSPYSPSKNPYFMSQKSRMSSSRISEKSWLEKSRIMRESCKHKMNFS